MNGLDLFSGIGGLALALEPYVVPVAYCESDRHAQAVLLSRMYRGELLQAPIWDDVRTLSGEGLPPVDIIYGGFPCQDISTAGRGRGLEGERSGLYWQIHRLVGECRPAFVFLENVPAIRTRGLDSVVRSLADLGYDCRWTSVSAAEVGAPHLRKRWFLLAYSDGKLLRNESRRRDGSSRKGKVVARDDGSTESLAYAAGKRSERGFRKTQSINYGSIVADRSSTMGDAESDGLESDVSPNGSSVQQQPDGAAKSEIRRGERNSGSDHWAVEPDVGRVAHGIPARLDRLRGLGNAVVPLQARTAFARISGIES